MISRTSKKIGRGEEVVSKTVGIGGIPSSMRNNDG